MTNDSILPIVDQATFSQLVFVAIVGWLTTKFITSDKSDRAGTVAFVIVLPMYFFHHFSFALLLDDLFAVLFRSLLVAYSVYSTTSLIATIYMYVARKIQLRREWRQRLKELDELRRQKERIAAERNKPLPPSPPPLTPKERAELFAKRVREEFEIEVELLKSLPLDDDARAVLTNDAEIKLLRRLKERK